MFRPKFLLAFLVSALLASSALAQSSASSNPPYNVDLGAITGSTGGITNTARAPSTVNTAQQSNVDHEGVLCAINITAESGSPAVTLAIQGYDTANNAYFTVAISGSINTTQVDAGIISHPGEITGDAPSNFTVKGINVPRYWRLQQVITGAGTTLTGKTSCQYLR